MKPSDYLLYGITVFGWSTSWLPLRWQLGVVAPEVSLFWRFLIASLLMFAITRLMGKSVIIPWRHHPRLAAMGLFLFSLNFTMFYYGGLHTASGMLAVVFATASIMIMLLMAVIQRRLPRAVHMLAALMGFAGVGIIFAPMIDLSGAIMTTLVLCLIGTLVFSTGSVISSSNQGIGLPVMASNCWGMAYGALYLGLASLFRGHEFIIEPSVTYVGGLLWLAVVSSVGSFTAYLLLVGSIGPGRAGYATVVFPVFALMISSLIEGYQWSLMAVAGLVLVSLGNWLMVRYR
ncbi:MAG: DMT family transporter [Candidatus Puniceispirillales bacterium]